MWVGLIRWNIRAYTNSDVLWLWVCLEFVNGWMGFSGDHCGTHGRRCTVHRPGWWWWWYWPVHGSVIFLCHGKVSIRLQSVDPHCSWYASPQAAFTQEQAQLNRMRYCAIPLCGIVFISEDVALGSQQSTSSQETRHLSGIICFISISITIVLDCQ